MENGKTKSPIKTFRKENEITQADFAARLGVQAPAISKWESGRVPAEWVLKIEASWGIPRHLIRPDLYPVEREVAASASS